MSTELDEKYKAITAILEERLESFDIFLAMIKRFFESKRLATTIHSVRARTKDLSHLLDKIERKNNEDLQKPEAERKGPIDELNIFNRITDINGIRVLHLHQSQFSIIHEEIMKKTQGGDFCLFEDPVAYTWDQESANYFRGLDIKTEVKESYYTSIHYVLKPNMQSPVTCEVQVRTLFEEVWGEVDHTMNYPERTTSEPCKEQLKVLARLVGAGGHLADSIMRHYKS